MPLYEEIEFEDMTYDSETQIYSYPCPCGDRFKVSLEDLWDGEDIAYCQSCTLFIQVIYEEEDLPPLPEEDDDEEEEDEEKEDTKQYREQDKQKDEKNEYANSNSDKDVHIDDDVAKAVEKLSISSTLIR